MRGGPSCRHPNYDAQIRLTRDEGVCLCFRCTPSSSLWRLARASAPTPWAGVPSRTRMWSGLRTTRRLASLTSTTTSTLGMFLCVSMLLYVFSVSISQRCRENSEIETETHTVAWSRRLLVVLRLHCARWPTQKHRPRVSVYVSLTMLCCASLFPRGVICQCVFSLARSSSSSSSSSSSRRNASCICTVSEIFVSPIIW